MPTIAELTGITDKRHTENLALIAEAGKTYSGFSNTEIDPETSESNHEHFLRHLEGRIAGSQYIKDGKALDQTDRELLIERGDRLLVEALANQVRDKGLEEITQKGFSRVIVNAELPVGINGTDGVVKISNINADIEDRGIIANKPENLSGFTSNPFELVRDPGKGSETSFYIVIANRSQMPVVSKDNIIGGGYGPTPVIGIYTMFSGHEGAPTSKTNRDGSAGEGFGSEKANAFWNTHALLATTEQVENMISDMRAALPTKTADEQQRWGKIIETAEVAKADFLAKQNAPSTEVTGDAQPAIQQQKLRA